MHQIENNNVSMNRSSLYCMHTLEESSVGNRLVIYSKDVSLTA